MIQQHELVGMGLGEVILFDEKKMRVEIKSANNTYLRYAEKLFDVVEPSNFYLCGLAAGITTAYFDAEIECDETQVRSGNCVLKPHPGQRNIPKKLQEITNRSLTVKHYLQ